MLNFSSKEMLPLGGLFNDFVQRVAQNQAKDGAFTKPAMDIYEDENSYILSFNLAGIRKNEVKLSLQNSLLNIETNRANAEEKAKTHYRERYLGNYQRSVTLPEDADNENVKATMENGVLTVTVNKKENRIKKEISVE